MPPECADFLPKVESWITRLAGPYGGDLVTEQIHSSSALQAQMARNGLYVRGPTAKLAKAENFPEIASSSVKDSFLLCMLEPPESRSDKTVLSKVRGVNFAGVAPNIRRFYEAEIGLAVLQPWWETRCEPPKSSRFSRASKGARTCTHRGWQAGC